MNTLERRFANRPLPEPLAHGCETSRALANPDPVNLGCETSRAISGEALLRLGKCFALFSAGELPGPFESETETASAD